MIVESEEAMQLKCSLVFDIWQLNMLNNTKTFKAGLKRKQKKAAMSTRYLSEVLAGCGVS